LKKSKRWKEAIAIKIIKRCLVCGVETDDFLNPLTAVDIIIEFDKRSIILIKRKNAPRGWAMPGGFVNYGESLEEAAIREAKEETRLDIRLIRQLHTYSDPARDPRRHTISTVFIAEAGGTPLAADDAEEIGIFMEDNLPQPLMFDHAKILADYFQERDSHRQLIPDGLIKCQIGK
jgi:ADP-ribose pyrophosphatase YjhB (NUDIX family)